MIRTDDLPDDSDTDGKRTVRSYLGKSLRTLSTVAGMSPGDVEDATSAQQSGNVDADLWKIALYWATGKAFFDGSPELTTDDPNDDEDTDTLPHVPCYRFVGVAWLTTFPGTYEAVRRS